MYGTKKVSIEERRRERLDKSHGTMKDCIERTAKENEKRKSGLKRPYNHVGKTDTYVWDKLSCLQEVQKYKPKDEINFSKLARKYNLKLNGKLPSNSGQVMRKLLEEENIDIEKFTYHAQSIKRNATDVSRARRKRIR